MGLFFFTDFPFFLFAVTCLESSHVQKHPTLRNINLNNITPSLMSENHVEQIFSIEIFLLVVTFLSLVSWVLTFM